jgi:hypothetical protein
MMICSEGLMLLMDIISVGVMMALGLFVMMMILVVLVLFLLHMRLCDTVVPAKCDVAAVVELELLVAFEHVIICATGGTQTLREVNLRAMAS